MVCLLFALVEVGVEDSLLVKPHPIAEECEVVGVVEVVDVVVVAVAVDTSLVAASPQLALGLVTTGRGGLPVNIIVLGFILQATVEGESPRAGPSDQVVLEGVLAGGRVTVEGAVASVEGPGVPHQVVVQPDVSVAVLGQVVSVLHIVLPPGVSSSQHLQIFPYSI